MPHESLVLSLEIFDDIESWTSTKHEALAIRVLLGQLIEVALGDDIYQLLSTYEACEVYKEMCGPGGVNFDRRVRMIEAVLALFANTPVLAKRFPHRKTEWAFLKDLVDAEEKDRLIKGKYAFQWLNAATGVMQATAAEFGEGMDQLHKLGFTTAEKKRAVLDVLSEISDAHVSAPKTAEKLTEQWGKQLKLLELFDADDTEGSDTAEDK